MVRAFYLPGIAPYPYQDLEEIKLFVDKLDSARTQLPYEFYDLPFCPPFTGKDPNREGENIGEILAGERIETSPYEIKMKDFQNCVFLCTRQYTKDEVAKWREVIEEEYRVNWIMDNMPAVVRYEHGDDVRFKKGFSVGFTGNPVLVPNSKDGGIYLNNHHRINILIHADDSYEGNRIVGFEVEPFSIKHNSSPDGNAGAGLVQLDCGSKLVELVELPDHTQMADEELFEVVWTYDVVFEQSPIKWASRWDMYLKAGYKGIHWFAIVNSLVILTILTFMVALILMKTLNKDISNFNQVDPEALTVQQDETGWKLLHGNVFRAPDNPEWLAVLVGTGFQVFTMTLILLFFALLGFLSPANRGGLMTSMLFLFVFMGYFAGYYGTRLLKAFGSSEWRSHAIRIALFYPGINFAVFFFLDLCIWGTGSTGAVPFGTLFILLLLWFGISTPLVCIGAYFGYRREAISFPSKVSMFIKPIPDQPWYLKHNYIAGVLPFGAVFIELFFVMSSIWLHRFYYLFGFLGIVLLILVITCAEISIVMVYLQLCRGNYKWWWSSFITAGSSAIYVFLYSCVYFMTKLEISGFVPTLIYFSYMGLVSLAFFILTGTIGFVSSFLFVKKIYSEIHII